MLLIFKLKARLVMAAAAMNEVCKNVSQSL